MEDIPRGGETTIPADTDKLRQLTEFMPDGLQYVYDFARYVADVIGERKTVTPSLFLQAVAIASLELKHGIDLRHNQPITAPQYKDLVGQPDEFYSQLEGFGPTIAHAVYPADFAQAVEVKYNEAIQRKQNREQT